MTKSIRPIVFMAALAVVLVIAVPAQQKSDSTPVDPVCGMTVAKASAKGTFDYKGTTYYFCKPACQEAFAKDPEKYLKAQTMGEEAKTPEPRGMMPGRPMTETPKAEAGSMAGCPMKARGMMMHGRMGRMGMMHGGMGHGRGGKMGMGADVEMTVEKTKDGAVLKVTSNNAGTVKAIQEHMTEHVAMMKKMKEAAANASESDACAKCPMMKETKK